MANIVEMVRELRQERPLQRGGRYRSHKGHAGPN